MKYDIKVVNNMIGGRQGWAYICNSGKYVILEANHTIEQEYENYYKWKDQKVRIAWNYNGYEHYDNAFLAWDGQHSEDKFEFTGGGAMLKDSFNMSDALEMIDNANAPIVHGGDVIAIAHIYEDSVALSLYRVGKVDIHCYTRATMTMLSEDEMQEIKAKAERWCRR